VAGDPTKVGVWPDADVYIADTDAEIPADVDTPFDAAWKFVGLLDGDAGFVQSREEDVADHYAWGGILVRTTRRQFKQTVTFTALEDNDTTRELIWPGSSAGELKVPRPARKKIAFETREGDKVRRLISKFEAEITINGDITDSEGAPTSYELQATIFPDADGVLFVEQKSDVGSS